MKRKNTKKFIGILLVLVMLVNVILPLVTVFADDDENFVFTIEVENSNNYSIAYTSNGLEITDKTKQENNKNMLEVISNSGANISTEVETVCNEGNTSCTVTVPKTNVDVKFRWNGSAFDITVGNNKITPDDAFDHGVTLSIKPPTNEPGGESGGESGEDRKPFDGRAVVVWSCGNGVCYHEFGVVDPEHCNPEEPTDACKPEIGKFDDGKSTYFKDTDIEADNKPGEKFNVHADYIGWYLKDEFEYWQTLYEVAKGSPVNWNTLDPELIIGEPNQHIRELEEAVGHTCDEAEDHEACIHMYAAEHGQIWTHKLQPVGEPTDKNAYVSYGDRNFKVVIYNSDYKGVSTTADFGGLHYYPISWADPFTRTDQYDISGTDKNHPKGLLSILLEDTVNLDILPYNNYEVESIEALDVPEDAVTITKISNVKYKIVFTSHFYDNVKFKLTDTNGEESYVRIKRFTIDGWIRDDSVLSADFYYDRNDSYEDFIITAKVIYNDGTVENVTLEPVSSFRDSLGNPINNYEADQEVSGGPLTGKGLKQSVFEYTLGANAERRVKDIYLNAEYKGSSSSVYAGAYSGSGEGTQANLYHGEEE